MKNTRCCVKCGQPLSTADFFSSVELLGTPLCAIDLAALNAIESTKETKTLYVELLRLGIPANLPQHYQISIPDVRLNIILSDKGPSKSDQSKADLLRENYSINEGTCVIKIENELIQSDISYAVRYIVKKVETYNAGKRQHVF